MSSHKARSGFFLDRTEAIRKFIKLNLKILLASGDFPEELYKRAKRQYFIEQLKNDVGKPRDADIAHEAMMHLFRTRQITNEATLTAFLSRPFFATHIRETELYKQYLAINVQEKTSDSVDWTKLRMEDARQETDWAERVVKADRLNRIEQDLEKVKLEKLEQLTGIDRKIEERKKELEAYPSILDEEEEPAKPLESHEPEQSNQPWWSRLGLVGDPFPSTMGLGKISKELYEKIVYKDVLLRKYLSLARDMPSELFRSTIFFGQFGSGKTTLFEYLNSVAFPICGIHGIYIQLYDELDVHSLRISFQNKLIDELVELYETMRGVDPRTSILSPSFSPDKAINVLIRELSGNEPSRFVVFIDDLHKNREISVAMGFLSLLQTIETELTRRQPKLSFAIYVAGSTEWESAVRSETARLSGSFSRYEYMPPLSPEAAAEMLTRRFEAFSPDQDNPIAPQNHMVNQVYRYLQNNQLPITYRQFINTVVEQFKTGSFEDWFDVFQIPEDQLARIRLIIEASPRLKVAFQSLLDYTKSKPETRQRCVRAVATTYVNNGVTEEEKYLKDHTPEFKIARKAGLLQRQRLDESHFKWVVCPELLEKNTAIRTEFNFSLQEYLPQIYGTTILRKVAAEVNEEVKQVLDFADSPTASRVREYLKESGTLHESILGDQEKLIAKQCDPEALVKSCKASLVVLTKAALASQAIEFAKKSDDEVVSWWTDCWFPLEDVNEFLNFEKDKRGKPELRAARACNAYRQAYPVIFGFVKSQCDKARYLRIPITDLTDDEIRTANEIRDQLAELEYFEAAEATTILVEEKLRRLLFNVFRLLYGDDREFRMRRVGKISRGQMLDNIDRDRQDGFAEAMNEFEHLNRKSYQFFMIPGKNAEPIAAMNWSELFQAIFYPMSEVDIRDFLDKFARFDIRTGHGKEESIGPEQQSLVSHYVQRALEILVKFNGAYLKLVQPTVRVYDKETVMHSRIFRGQKPGEFFFSFCRLKDRDIVRPITLEHFRTLMST